MGFTSMFLRSVLQLGSTVVLIGAVTPFALPPLVPIMLLFYFLYLYLCAVAPSLYCSLITANRP